MSLARAQAELLERLHAPALPADEGLAVHHRTLRAAWRGALEHAYPVVLRLVGESFFDAAATRYGEAHPSRGGDLHDFGAHLAAFLGSDGPSAALEYLPDVARLEWAVHRCAQARDPVAFDVAALAALAPERHASLRLVPQAGTALVDSRHAIVTIWEANQPPRDGTPDRPLAPECALVHRDGLEVRVRRLSEADVALLRELLSGASLGHACGDERRAARVPAWVREGLFAGFTA